MPAFAELLQQTPFTKLLVRSEEGECWLAGMALFAIKEQLFVDCCILCPNYILAADEKDLKRYFKYGKAFDPILTSIQEHDEALLPLFAVMAARLNTVPLFGQRLVMVAADLTNHGELGNNRHVYTLVFWRSEANLLNILMMDPLNVSKSLHDFGLRIPTSLWRILNRWQQTEARIYRHFGNETISDTDCQVRALIYAERFCTEPNYLDDVLNMPPALHYVNRVHNAASERNEPDPKKPKVTTNTY